MEVSGNKQYRKIDRARNRINQLKGFYKHLLIFVVFNGLLLLFKKSTIALFFGEEVARIPKASSWVYWNLAIWGIILAIHAIAVFGKKPIFLRKWEERQMKKYMNEDF